MIWFSNISPLCFRHFTSYSHHIILNSRRDIVPHCNIAFLQNWHLAYFLLVTCIVWLSLLPPFPFSQLVSQQLYISYLIPAAACTICGLDGWGEPPDPRRTLEEGSPPRFEVLRQHLCQHHKLPTQLPPWVPALLGREAPRVRRPQRQDPHQARQQLGVPRLHSWRSKHGYKLVDHWFEYFELFVWFIDKFVNVVYCTN